MHLDHIFIILTAGWITITMWKDLVILFKNNFLNEM